ncbi:MAG: two pore domain potassium channel family protein [Myxococcales bacterium]|nr:MAG: two pore domain potassium channel family protein [Myxococcales bacterium]
MKTLEQLAGVVVLAVALADIFLTMLYARMDSGWLAMRFARGIERVWVWISRPFGRSRARFASFCGPVTLLAVLGLWTGLLTLGSALVVHPALGQAVRPSNGAASTDFVTALYVGGASVSVVGSSGYSPQTPIYRMFFLLNSAVGMTFLSLVLTYLGQVYTALLRRNALALRIHGLSEAKGDGAELVCRLWPHGELSSGTSELADLAAEVAVVKESHHFYPVLMYFRFEEPHYSVSRIVSVSLDAMSLVMSTLDDERFGAVKESSSVTLLWRSSLWLASSLAGNIAPASAGTKAPDVALWRRRYAAALERLRSAGIATVADLERGFERYAELRSRWDGLVRALAPALAFSTEEVDLPLAHAKNGH